MGPIILCVAMLAAAPSQEPAARPAAAVPLLVDPAITHVSAATELPDGRVLVSDARKPAVYVLDPKTGKTSPLGSAGAGEHQYVKPGGFYGGPKGTTLLLDRAQARVLTISRDGQITGSSSIAVRGTQSSSDRDVDLQRPDANGHAYFPESMGFRSADGSNTTPLLRFDPIAQRSDTVARLGLPEVKTFPGGDGVTFGRKVIGSPEDGWGVTPDGRVAVVRAAPYRIEWHLPGGRVVQGPVVHYDPVPMTDADKRAFAGRSGPGPSVGLAGGGQASSLDPGTLFAPTKAPFDPDGVVVSPDGRVWVNRNRPASATTVIYDVFDAAGRRAARLELPAGSRIAGFGRSCIYVRETAPSGAATLKKYKDS